MNQAAIGSYIARKRKEKNLTQEQLAEHIGASNKTVSKWENGKRMPDYSILQKLCAAHRSWNIRKGSSAACFWLFSALPATPCRV